MQIIESNKRSEKLTNGEYITHDSLGFCMDMDYNFTKLQKILDLIETLYILNKLHGATPLKLKEFIIIEGGEPQQLLPDFLDELLEIDVDKYRDIVDDQIKRLEQNSKVFLFNRMPWTRYEDMARRRIGYLRRLAIYITPEGDKTTEIVNVYS